MQASRSGQRLHAAPNRARPPPRGLGGSPRDPGRAGDRLGLEVDAELVFGEPAAGRGGKLGVDHRCEPVAVQPGQVRAGAIGAVAIDHPAGGLLALAWDQVAQQPGRHRRVAGGCRADLGRADDLAVGVHREVTLVAVEAVGGGLVAMACFGVDGGDDPVGCGAFEDAEAAVVGLFDILAGDGGQQHGRLGDPRVQPLVPQGVVGPVAVADQGVHQRLPSRRSASHRSACPARRSHPHAAGPLAPWP